MLAGRKTVGEIKGEICFSAQKPTKAFLRRYTGYVEQFDTLLDILTVRDMLLYTAELKRPVSEPYAKKVEVVDRFIELLALDGCKDVLIGNSLNRCAWHAWACMPAVSSINPTRMVSSSVHRQMVKEQSPKCRYLTW